MNLHINTALIVENFSKTCECPLCEIEETVDKWLVEQFLSEAVMEDHAREEVNKKGFCYEHLRKLFAGSNKLGFALQLQTRLAALRPKLTGKPKAAKKTAETLAAELSSCVICDMKNANMERYAETVAGMYKKDAEFRKKFEESKGFCLKHYRELLLAGGTPEFVESLERVQAANMDRLSEELAGFIQKFDHRYADKPWGTSKDAHIRAMQKYQGK